MTLFIDGTFFLDPNRPTADARLLNIGMAGIYIVACTYLVIMAIKATKKKPVTIPVSKPVDNIETRSAAIAREINKVQDEEKLYDTLRLIKMYEGDYLDDYNAQREAADLRIIWNAKARKIFGVEEMEEVGSVTP